MTESDLLWCEIAERIGCSAGEARAKVPTSEFWAWVKKFERDNRRTTQEHVYSAQISFQVFLLRALISGFIGVPVEDRTFEDFLMDFSEEGELKETPEEREAREERESEELALRQIAAVNASVRSLSMNPALPPGTVEDKTKPLPQ